MVAGNQNELAFHPPKDLMNNPITHLQTKFKELEHGFKGWLTKQSLPVEAAVVTLTSAAQGAAIGGFMGTLTGDAASSFPVAPPPGAALNSQTMASYQQAQVLAGGPLIQARNFAVITGVNAGISCVMKRLRGKEDVETSMVAAFGSGVMFSLVSGMGGPNPATNVITSGVFFALVQGGLFKVVKVEAKAKVKLSAKWSFAKVRSERMAKVIGKDAVGSNEATVKQVGQKFSKPPVEDVMYSETKSMLSRLGLENYEKNFKKGLLTDNTLPLLTDSALRDVRIPPGPRLVILDHVQRNKVVKGGGRRT